MILRVGKRTVTEREAASLCVSSDGISQEETLGARKPERCLKRVLLGVHCGTFSQLPLRFFFEVSEKRRGDFFLVFFVLLVGFQSNCLIPDIDFF